jgi:hypothetical protein
MSMGFSGVRGQTSAPLAHHLMRMNTDVINGRGVAGATVASCGLINYEDVMT